MYKVRGRYQVNALALLLLLYKVSLLRIGMMVIALVSHAVA